MNTQERILEAIKMQSNLMCCLSALDGLKTLARDNPSNPSNEILSHIAEGDEQKMIMLTKINEL
tara:strand:+ start:326 stop:517 length:192 start_codon:yes stop_codon:yes gene_type:complete